MDFPQKENHLSPTMPRCARRRAIPFEGDDEQYIKHLERLVLSLQPLLTFPISDATGSSASDIRFIEWQPGKHPPPLSPQWMKQLVAFIEGIPRQDRWQEARVKAGIDTPYRNFQALKLILGHADPAIFHAEYEIAAPPSAPPLGSVDLVARGCEYGRFIAQCRHDQSFAESVVAFQHLVFYSFCVVMMRAGVSLETTNATMRRYTGKDQKDHTLEKYRNGAVWANRCIALLLENGWGHKSWEIFLLSKYLRGVATTLSHFLPQIVRLQRKLPALPLTTKAATRW